jgi:ketol-acid reductoisomerase
VEVLEVCGDFRGRSNQFLERVKLTTADVLMFLDDDSIVPKGYDESIIEILKAKRVVGCAFGFKLDGKDFC